MTFSDQITRLFIQLAIIMLACRVMSYLGNRFLKQTHVVCEMLAGVFLGPSLLGLIFPEFQSWLFPNKPLLLDNGQIIPDPSMSLLYAFSQIGLAFYMFLTGMEFNTSIIKKRIKSAGVISLTGIILPFSLGALFILCIPDSSSLFRDHFPLSYHAVFLGICLSITAFPMLARILEQNGISKTKFGTIALAAGSMDDLIAWIMLAMLLSMIKENVFILMLAAVGTIIYVVFLLLIKKRMNTFMTSNVMENGELKLNSFSIVLILLFSCALFTELIGIYLIFGSFLLGIIMPRGEFTEQIRMRTIDLISALFLPTFFVFSGLNTQIGLLNSIYIWGIALCILLIAVIGKGIGCMLAAKAVGESWAESATIGSLMNARGLMELIAINIGLQANIITPELYTILVIMAIVTTLLTSPLYYWIMGSTNRLKN